MNPWSTCCASSAVSLAGKPGFLPASDAVAEQLHLSVNTVRTHLQNAMAKLGVHSALEAVALIQNQAGWPYRSGGSLSLGPYFTGRSCSNGQPCRPERPLRHPNWDEPGYVS